MIKDLLLRYFCFVLDNTVPSSPKSVGLADRMQGATKFCQCLLTVDCLMECRRRRTLWLIILKKHGQS